MTIQTDTTQPQASINFTPMIDVLDVLLVLLIIFIAAAGLEFGVVANAIDVAHGTSIDRIALIPRWSAIRHKQDQ